MEILVTPAGLVRCLYDEAIAARGSRLD